VSLPGPRHSRGSGCRAGWPSYSHRPASIDLSKARSLAASLARESANPRISTSRATPHGASSDGPPAPHRLEQPSPCTTPISDIPRRHRGHRLAGSRTDRKLTRRTPCDAHPALDPRDLDRSPAAPFGASRLQSECLPSCRNEPESPLAPMPRSSSLIGKRGVTRAPFSPRSRRGVRQHVMRSSPRPAPPRRLALRLAERGRRAMRRTDFCHLTLRTSTRASPVLDASAAFAVSHAR